MSHSKVHAFIKHYKIFDKRLTLTTPISKNKFSVGGDDRFRL